MKVQIASDLHLEFYKEATLEAARLPPAPNANVLVIAGDIARGTTAIEAFRDWPVPVIYVYGNHEHYGLDMSKNSKAIRAAAEGTAIHFLERGEAVIDGVRFLGTCLWTDYLLFGREKQAAAMQYAEDNLRDHGVIKNSGKWFKAKDALHRHVLSKNWLRERLDTPFEGPTVVVTHHAPHTGSIHEKYASDLLCAAFVSDLTPLMGNASLWIHGHVHDSFDYHVAGTRIIANPRGYPLKRNGIEYENPGFDPILVAEI